MKKLVILLASFVLSTGVSLAGPASSDCDDEVKPISVSMAQS